VADAWDLEFHGLAKFADHLEDSYWRSDLIIYPRGEYQSPGG
jgi:hypothetical protein